MPAALAEIGFVTGAEDAARLAITWAQQNRSSDRPCNFAICAVLKIAIVYVETETIKTLVRFQDYRLKIGQLETLISINIIHVDL